MIRHEPVPRSAQEAFVLRQALYEGAVVRFSKTPASVALGEAVLALVQKEVGEPIRSAQFRYDNQGFFERIGRVRKAIFTEPAFHEGLRDVIASCSFPVDNTAFDPLRLRVVAHNGHQNPLAAPVYYPHRDTWYAHPQCQITWWIALHDAPKEETFVFYPERFAKAVPNNSEIFDYERWLQDGDGLKIGWQDIQAGKRAAYPGLIKGTEPLSFGPEVGFSCSFGEILLFAGAHFHKTLDNQSGQTRFSLDFRTADLVDFREGRGAINVDNRSTGSALLHYVQPRSD